MKLTLISKSSDYHSGYGAGSGELIREEYECPCGAGIVVYEKDDIPGFRDSSLYCTCKKCNDKYDIGRGMVKEKKFKKGYVNLPDSELIESQFQVLIEYEDGDQFRKETTNYSFSNIFELIKFEHEGEYDRAIKSIKIEKLND